MTNREFNKWLEGFLEACEVHDVSELSGEKLSIVVQKLKKVRSQSNMVEGYYVSTPIYYNPVYYKLSDLLSRGDKI